MDELTIVMRHETLPIIVWRDRDGDLWSERFTDHAFLYLGPAETANPFDALSVMDLEVV
jgi:hypothetical protein